MKVDSESELRLDGIESSIRRAAAAFDQVNRDRWTLARALITIADGGADPVGIATRALQEVARGFGKCS